MPCGLARAAGPRGAEEGLLTMRTIGPREKREPGHEAGLRQPLKDLFCHVVNKKCFPSSGSTFSSEDMK